MRNEFRYFIQVRWSIFLRGRCFVLDRRKQTAKKGAKDVIEQFLKIKKKERGEREEEEEVGKRGHRKRIWRVIPVVLDVRWVCITTAACRVSCSLDAYPLTKLRIVRTSWPRIFSKFPFSYKEATAQRSELDARVHAEESAAASSNITWHKSIVRSDISHDFISSASYETVHSTVNIFLFSIHEVNQARLAAFEEEFSTNFLFQQLLQRHSSKFNALVCIQEYPG